MARPRPLDLALVAVSCASAVVLTWLGSLGWLDWMFITVMFSCLALVTRSSVGTWYAARREGRRVAQLSCARPDAIARAAVAEERRRLEDDITRCLRDSLTDVVEEARGLEEEPDPVPALRRIQARTRAATSELRRQLGLLRQVGVDEPFGPAVIPAPAAAPGPVPRRDLFLGLAAALLASVEGLVYLPIERPGAWTPWSVVLSTVAAAAVVGPTAAPARAAVFCGAVFGVGTLLGAPVTGGLWALLTLGTLTWAIAAARLTVAGLASLAFLVTTVGVTRRVSDPENLQITLVVIGVAGAAGLFAGWSTRRRQRASSVATRLEGELRAAAAEAVLAERAVFARELHDIVSHAVGLIAMQAGAADVSWPHDPAVLRSAVGVIRATAEETLADLDRLRPVAQASAGPGDLRALVDRIRASGTQVDLTVSGTASSPEVVYRVVQEALTNVVRHAPGAAVDVVIDASGGPTLVQVTDDGPGPAESSRRGYGLVGLSERVRFSGGTFEAGAGPDGQGFRVSVTLPGARADAAFGTGAG